MMRALTLLCCSLLLVSLVGTVLATELSSSFDDLSRQTRQAMHLTSEELAVLLKDCDRLSAQITQLQGSKKKILLKRLKRMRGVFSYVLQSKQVSQVKEGEK
ncbi:MAG: hypothetical protein L3J63_11700 [Geopsychrobacter sp.]|nr:hypothetical protein [Geopsychrobacter sp.]